jgi:hypothetical protein
VLLDTNISLFGLASRALSQIMSRTWSHRWPRSYSYAPTLEHILSEVMTFVCDFYLSHYMMASKRILTRNYPFVNAYNYSFYNHKCKS